MFAGGSIRRIMKLISLSEARDHLNEYGQLCQEETVIVHIDGVPQFQLAPLDDDLDFMNRLIETNPEFQKAMAKRNSTAAVSAEEALRRMEE